MPDRSEELREAIAEANGEIDALYEEIRVLERFSGDSGTNRIILAEKRRKLAKLHEECAEMMRTYFDLNPLKHEDVEAMAEKSHTLPKESQIPESGLNEDSAGFLAKMSDLYEKQMRLLNAGDKVADWFQRRVASSGFFTGWFWTILGVCFLFFVFLPLFYIVDVVFRLIEWRYSRALEHHGKKAKSRKR